MDEGEDGDGDGHHHEEGGNGGSRPQLDNGRKRRTPGSGSAPAWWQLKPERD